MGESGKIVAELLAHAAERNPQAMAELLADDVVIHLAGRSQHAGEHAGKEGFFAFFGGLVEASGGTFRPAVHAITDEGEHVVALIEISATSGGRRATWPQANVYHVRDGLVTEVWLLPMDLYAFDEFWG